MEPEKPTPANPDDHGYSAIDKLPVQAKHNYAPLSLVAALYLYWIWLVMILLEIVFDDVIDTYGFLVDRNAFAVVNLIAVVAGAITLWERRQMSRKNWLPCNRHGLPLGRAAARTGLLLGLAQLIIVLNFIVNRLGE